MAARMYRTRIPGLARRQHVVNRLIHAFVWVSVTLSLLTPVAWAQKPPAPPTPPPNPPTGSGPGSGSSTRPTSPFPANSNTTDAPEDFVVYLMGQVATDDGSALPNEVKVERVCNASVRQQVYASPAG